jgi:hypothetical protein
VLKSHKKWENEKYFGNNNSFKRQFGAASASISAPTGNTSNSDFIYFSADVLNSKIRKNDKGSASKEEGLDM